MTALPELGAAPGKVRTAAFRSIRERKAPTAQELAAAIGLDEGVVREAISSLVEIGMAVVDAGGRVVGSAGLSLVPSRHRLQLGDENFHTWCAIDALGIPVALETEAVALTSCPTCQRTIRVEAHGGRLTGDPNLRAWLPQLDCCSSVVDEACPDMNLFCGEEHLQAWREANAHPSGTTLSLSEVEQLGRAWWADLV